MNYLNNYNLVGWLVVNTGQAIARQQQKAA